MRRSVTRTWLVMCAALYAAVAACSSSQPSLPPVEASGTPGAGCELGNACNGNGAYCVAGGQGCKYLECVGGAWKCPSDASVSFDAGGLSREAASGGDAADAADGAQAPDGPNAADATDASAESGKSDASGD